MNVNLYVYVGNIAINVGDVHMDVVRELHLHKVQSQLMPLR